MQNDIKSKQAIVASEKMNDHSEAAKQRDMNQFFM